MNNFHFDIISFFIGMIVATAVWWVISLSRPLLDQMLETNRQRQKDRALRASSALEDAHRKMVYKQTQGMHLAASLFSLDEIAITTTLLAPPAVAEPHNAFNHLDIVDKAIPYIPNTPELAAFYHARALTIPQALSGGMNLVLTGQPGSGKTIALARLASQIANRDPEVLSLHEFIPILIHAADLGLPLSGAKKAEDFLAPISAKLAQSAGVFDAPRIPGFVNYAFTSGRALLLLDGVDELPQAEILEVSTYLRVILRTYKQTRVIVAGAPEFIDGILSLGFCPMAIMPWSSDAQKNFAEKWSALWEKYVSLESWAKADGEAINPLLLNRWLSTDNFGLSPLEFTLKIWGAFAGDARGPSPVDSIEAHLRRLCPENTPFEALNTLASQAVLNGSAIFDTRQAREWTRSFEPAEPAANAETAAAPAEGEIQPATAETGTPDAQKDPRKPNVTTNAGLISRLAGQGLLANHANSRVRFINPVFLGYLAGKGLHQLQKPDLITNQPGWSGQTTTLRYIAAFGDAGPFVARLLAAEDFVTLRPRIVAGRMLREAPRASQWRTSIMGALVQLLQDPDVPVALRGQVMTIIALSGDPSVTALFRQLLRASSSELRHLAALGAGMMRDTKSVDVIAGMLPGANSSARQAACLALVEIGSPEALEAVAGALLHGDEELRITSAEALANHPTEGQEALKEGITSQDILVRRAIIYGLARVEADWAVDLMTRAQLEDEQWLVRNVAVEMINARQAQDPHIPRKLTPPAETPWLIEYAGKHGMGIIPGQPATDLLLLALKEQSREYYPAALNYLKYTPSEGVLASLYPYLYGTDAEIKESVFLALSDMVYSGASMPNPHQFGLG